MTFAGSLSANKVKSTEVALSFQADGTSINRVLTQLYCCCTVQLSVGERAKLFGHGYHSFQTSFRRWQGRGHQHLACSVPGSTASASGSRNLPAGLRQEEGRQATRRSWCLVDHDYDDDKELPSQEEGECRSRGLFCHSHRRWRGDVSRKRKRRADREVPASPQVQRLRSKGGWVGSRPWTSRRRWCHGPEQQHAFQSEPAASSGAAQGSVDGEGQEQHPEGGRGEHVDLSLASDVLVSPALGVSALVEWLNSCCCTVDVRTRTTRRAYSTV